MKRMFKFFGLIPAIALAGVLSMGSASAALFTSNDTCATTDVSAEADDCFGSINPNSNDSAELLNTNTFGTDINTDPLGLFGYTDWVELAKDDGVVTGDIGLSVDSLDATSGSWSVNSGALDLFARVVLVLKAGSTFVAYLYEPGSNAGSSGTWDTVALDNKDLSHFAIYASPVPVPAAVWLFGTALIGFIGMSRRTKV
jgi:hypothetical protein